jgi:hypothetical protein
MHEAERISTLLRQSGAGPYAESPLHGFQGDRGPTPSRPSIPASLTVAVSREAGARGGTIGKRVGKKLGWQVYDQELLEYTAQEGASRHVLAHLPPAAARWADERLEILRGELNLTRNPNLADIARIILALGAQGEVILIGRGAGCILPAASTLHVRIVAPLADRVAYMSQYLRLPEREAAEQVMQRDKLREEFIQYHFHREPGQVHQFDLILNSSLLGEDVCAELIAQAARAKSASMAASGLADAGAR